MRRIVNLAVVCFGAISVFSTMGAPVTFEGTDSHGRDAWVQFSGSGGTLVINLQNKATYDAMDPTDMLTAIFFNLRAGYTLSPVSAAVAAGSTVINTLTGNANYLPSGTALGAEWAYASSLNVGGLNAGTSSTGLGLFGNGNFGTGANLQGPVAVDGVQYGITTQGDIAATGNGGIKSQQSSQFIKDTVVLTLAALPTDFDPSWITDV